MDKLDRLIQCAIELQKHQIMIGNWPYYLHSCTCGTWEGPAFKEHLRAVALRELRSVSESDDPTP